MSYVEMFANKIIFSLGVLTMLYLAVSYPVNKLSLEYH